MGDLGKYTVYVGGVPTPAHKLISTLFSKGPFATAVTKGDELLAQNMLIAVATSDPGDYPNGGGIQPAHNVQRGDLGYFPKGVDLSFAGTTLDPPNSPPDIPTVKWTNPGDPANGYIPDIMSPTPGPGYTEGTDKTGDPTGTLPQIIADGTNSDPVRQNLRNPIKDGPAIYAANTVGQPQKLGESGGNV